MTMVALWERTRFGPRPADPMSLAVPHGQVEYPLARGVRGYTLDVDGDLWLPLISAVSEGSGDVGRYLDSLPEDRDVFVPNCISLRLEGMLRRRGFVAAEVWAPEMGETVTVMLRPAVG
jgi:hypothetical protein